MSAGVEKTMGLPRTGKLARHIPGEAGVWFFVLSDMMMFSLFFCIFLYYRSQDLTTFQTSQKFLNRDFGAINTVWLLTSSWFVAQAVQSLRDGFLKRGHWLFAGGFFFGCCFVVVKYFEYSEKLRAGITPMTNDFFMFYFMFTGIHLLHVLIGLALLSWVFVESKQPLKPQNGMRLYESVATFWHMVDLLWIVLFPLFYLIK